VLFLLRVVRLVLAILFAASAIAKLTSINSFRATLREFGVPAALERLLAWVIPVGELGVAVLLVPRSTASLGAALALVVLTIFSCAVIVMLASGRSIQCGCFGPLTGGIVGWHMLVRNAALIAAAALIFIGEKDNPEVLAALAALIVSSVVLARSVAPLRAATYGGPASADGVPIGTRAPAFSLTSAAGIPVTLGNLTSGGKPVLLVFTSPACRTCREIDRRVTSWQRDSSATLTLAIVRHNHEVSRAYGINRTPAALLITAGGIVASAPAFGAEAIDSLLGSATDLATAAESSP